MKEYRWLQPASTARRPGGPEHAFAWPPSKNAGSFFSVCAQDTILGMEPADGTRSRCASCVQFVLRAGGDE